MSYGPTYPAARGADISTPPLSAAFVSMASGSVAAIDAALTGTSPAIRQARDRWSAVRGIPEQIVALIDGNVATGPIRKVKSILVDDNLSAKGKTAQAQAITTRLDADVRALAARLRTGLDGAQAALTAGSTPPAAGDSAAQLVARQDVRMALDSRKSAVEVVRRAADLLARALSTGDGTVAHLLGAGDWLADYLVSRFSIDDADRLVEAWIGPVLDATLGQPGVAETRAAMCAFTGIDAAGLLRALLDQLPPILAGITRRAQLAAG